MHFLRWLPAIILLVPWLIGPAAPSTSQRIRDLAGPESFRLLDWETVHLAQRVGRLWTGLFGSSAPNEVDADRLHAYFAISQADRAALRPEAEASLENVIGNAYRTAGLTLSEPVPLPDNRLFPPLLVALTSPPNILVVAPRDALRVLDSTVMQAMDTPSQVRLESSADSTGVSSLIAPIGGLATYPSMVLDEDSAERVLTSVAHEWLHQYLIFYPLGKGYWSSQQTREINETTADMIGQEVGSRVANELGLIPVGGTRAATGASSSQPTFDFRAFMRETRLETERLLAEHQVDAAEAYMDQRRDEVARHGYAIRKLNQAYFALYGSYGDSYAASPADPIPSLLHTLRDRSATLGEFVIRVRELTTVADLERAVAG